MVQIRVWLYSVVFAVSAFGQMTLQGPVGIKGTSAVPGCVPLFEAGGGGTSTAKLCAPAALASDFTSTLPGATTVLAGLAVAETFTADQTFAANILASGSTREIGAAATPFNRNYSTVQYGTIFKVANPSSSFATAWSIQLGTSTQLDFFDNSGGIFARFDKAFSQSLFMSELTPGSTNTYDLGNSVSRWKKIWVVDIDCSGSCGAGGDLTEITASSPISVSSGTGPIPNVSCSTCITTAGGQTIGGNLTLGSGGVFLPAGGIQTGGNILVSSGSLSIGSTTTPFNNQFLTTSYATVFKVANPTSSFGTSWSIQLGTSTQLDFFDNAGSIFARFDKGFSQSLFMSQLTPGSNNTYDLGNSSSRWKKLYAVDVDMTTTLTHNGTTRINSSGDSFWNTVSVGGSVAIDGSRNLTNISSLTSSGAISTTAGNINVGGSNVFSVGGAYFGQDITGGVSLDISGGGTCTLYFKSGIMYAKSGC